MINMMFLNFHDDLGMPCPNNTPFLIFTNHSSSKVKEIVEKAIETLNDKYAKENINPDETDEYLYELVENTQREGIYFVTLPEININIWR